MGVSKGYHFWNPTLRPGTRHGGYCFPQCPGAHNPVKPPFIKFAYLSKLMQMSISQALGPDLSEIVLATACPVLLSFQKAGSGWGRGGRLKLSQPPWR